MVEMGRRAALSENKECLSASPPKAPCLGVLHTYSVSKHMSPQLYLEVNSFVFSIKGSGNESSPWVQIGTIEYSYTQVKGGAQECIIIIPKQLLALQLKRSQVPLKPSKESLSLKIWIFLRSIQQILQQCMAETSPRPPNPAFFFSQRQLDYISQPPLQLCETK